MFPFRGDVLRKRGSSCNAFDEAGLIVETPYGLQRLEAADFGIVNRTLQHGDGFVINFQRHGKGMAIFAAVGQGKSGGVAESVVPHG